MTKALTANKMTTAATLKKKGSLRPDSLEASADDQTKAEAATEVVGMDDHVDEDKDVSGATETRQGLG